MSTKRLSLKKNFSWNFTANLIFAITQWGILSIIAKWGTATMVGQYALGLAITAPIVLLADMQLRAVQATDVKDNYDFGEYMGLRFLTNIFAFIVIMLIGLLGGYDVETQIVIIMVGLLKIIDGFSDVIHGYFQRHERMDYSSKSKIIKGIFTIVLVGIVFNITGDLIYSLISMCVAYLFIFIVYDLRWLKVFREIKVSFQRKRLLGLIKLSYPLGIVLMLSSLYTNIPRFYLEKYTSLEALGYFSAIAYLLVAGNTFIGAVGQAISPRLAKEFARDDLKAFKKLLNKSMVIGFTIGTLLLVSALLIGEGILTLLYTEDYAEYNYLFIILSISAIVSFTSSFLGYAITATRSFNIQPFLALGWTISSVILSAILIPKFQLSGAAYTIVISSVVQFTLQIIYVHRKLKKKYK